MHMRFGLRSFVLATLGCLGAWQNLFAIDVKGSLHFEDTIAESTRPEMIWAKIRSLDTGADISARPNSSGEFLLQNVPAGHYRLQIDMPARIRSIQMDSASVNPLDFQILSQDTRKLEIVLSLAAAEVLVTPLGLPAETEVVVILAPDDPMLTLQESCTVNAISNNRAHFQFLAPGKYRLFVADARFQADIARYGPRLPAFLANEANSVDASSVDAKAATPVSVTASYIPAQVVAEAIRQAAGTP